MDAIYDEPGIRFITVRHEQAAGYMAYGYSRASGKTGAALVVPGPGLQNVSAAMGTAYSASTPIMVFAGQLPRDQIGKDRGELHEIDDQMDTVRPVAKWTGRALHTRDVPAMVNEASHQAQAGRPRPVEIEVPWDTLGEIEDVELREPARRERLAPSARSIREGAAILRSALRPVIWAGGGVVTSDASPELTMLAETLNTPVLTTKQSKGAISDRHPMAVGVPTYRSDVSISLVDEADVILAVGTRLQRAKVSDGSGPKVLGLHMAQIRADARVVRVDVDEAEIARSPSNTHAILGDAKLAMHALTLELDGLNPERPGLPERLESIARDRREKAARLQPQVGFVDAIRSALPDDAVIVEGVTQIGYASEHSLPAYQPRKFITSGYFQTLGYAYPTALGAKVAVPDSPVVAISGDGGFLYNSQEMATAAKYGINAIALVFNDDAYGNVLRDQVDHYDGRAIGSKLLNPDFLKLAEAYGVRGVRVPNAEGLESSLREAASIDAPTLIEIPVGMMDPHL
jgi:acetolactate synthase-1/2/3 large subunit